MLMVDKLDAIEPCDFILLRISPELLFFTIIPLLNYQQHLINGFYKQWDKQSKV